MASRTLAQSVGSYDGLWVRCTGAKRKHRLASYQNGHTRTNAKLRLVSVLKIARESTVDSVMTSASAIPCRGNYAKHYLRRNTFVAFLCCFDTFAFAVQHNMAVTRWDLIYHIWRDLQKGDRFSLNSTIQLFLILCDFQRVANVDFTAKLASQAFMTRTWFQAITSLLPKTTDLTQFDAVVRTESLSSWTPMKATSNHDVVRRNYRLRYSQNLSPNRCLHHCWLSDRQNNVTRILFSAAK